MAIASSVDQGSYNELVRDSDQLPERRRQSDLNTRREGFIGTTFEAVLGIFRRNASATPAANRSRR